VDIDQWCVNMKAGGGTPAGGPIPPANFQQYWDQLFQEIADPECVA